MKLVEFDHRVEYGHDWFLQVFFTKRWALFQGSVSWSDYRSPPFLQIQFGSGALLSVILNVYKFGISVGFFDRTWNFD